MKILVDREDILTVWDMLYTGGELNIKPAQRILTKILRDSITEEQKEIELDEYLAQTQRDWMD